MQSESAGRWKVERLAEERVDDTAVTGDGDVSTGMGVDEAPHGSSNASVEPRRRLAAREDLDVGIARPVRRSEARDVLVERHPVDFGSRIVLTEVGPSLDVREADRRRDDFGGLHGASEVTGDQHVRVEFLALAETLRQLLGLPTTEIAQPGAGSVPADDALHGHVGFAMPDQRDPRRFGVSCHGRIVRRAIGSPQACAQEATNPADEMNVTDLLDAEQNARPAPPAGPNGLMGDLAFDDAVVSDLPIAASALPPLPPPTMNTLAQPILTPQPSIPPAPALAPVPTLSLTPVPTLAPAPAPAVDSPVDAASGSPTDAAPDQSADAAVPDSARGESSPSLVTGPAAILSADPAFAPLDQTAPALPSAPAVKAAPAPTTAPLTLEDLFGQQPANGSAKKKKQGSLVGRSLRRLAILGVLAAGGYAAYEYGPGLYEQYVESDSSAVDPSETAPTETDAPLAFPNATPTAAPIRTAEFILEGLPGAPDMTYRVTTDFETNVSQVDVTRPSGPDLQILTYGESALIRNVDADQWYQLERGRFPLDDRLERADWVRQLDELLPTTIRSSVTIDDAGETTVSGVPTRRLSLSLDVALLGGTVPADSAPPVDPTAPVPAPEASADSATGPVTSLATSIEVWVDAEGLVRKVSGVPQLGAETITVVRTDGAAWVPNYPAPEFVQPLTAATLVELGI